MPVGLTPALDVEERTRTADLEALGPEWSALWSRCPSATPFQAPEWLIPWWRHFHDGRPLWALALRHRGALVGFVPLFLHAEPETGRRVVLLAGTGNTDYLDALIEPSFARRGLDAVLAHLAARRERWDVCDWQRLREGSPLRAAVPSGWAVEVVAEEPCPVLGLVAGDDDLSRTVPPGQLRRLRSERRRAEREGLSWAVASAGVEVEELFDALVRLHRARWGARGQPGVLADEVVVAFHREAVRTLARSGMLRLYGLRAGSRVLASLYGLAGQGRFYYYLGGFDPEFRHLSPGRLAVGLAIREAVREGLLEFDFLRGREPYKYEWGAADRTPSRCLVRPVLPRSPR